MNWVKYPDNKPTEDGYYITYYWHEDDQKNYYKAIYWFKDHWCKWQSNLPELKVKQYMPETRDDHYTTCVEKILLLGDNVWNEDTWW
jgi:hypothetical protein